MPNKSYNNLLENLFGRAPARVIKVFMHNPQAILTVGDIGRKAALKTKAAQTAVAGLVKMGVLEKTHLKKSGASN